MGGPLSDEELSELEALIAAATPGPWVAHLEEEGGLGGDSMIQVGLPGDYPPDMYVFHDREIAPSADLRFIAAARNYMPRLLAEVRRLRERFLNARSDEFPRQCDCPPVVARANST